MSDHDHAVADNHERQQNEVALLESMYPDELHIIRQPKSLDEDFELEVRLDQAHSLSFVLSRSYPASSPQVFLAFGPDVPNNTRKQLRECLRGIVDNQELGIECVDLIIGDFRQALDDMSTTETPISEPKVKVEQTLGLRVVLWMHHLLATSKRRAIVQLSRELSLGGFSKPGYPGSVYVEGEATAVKTFVDELKSMRWQAIQERATDAVPMESLTLTPGIQEVQGLGDIAESLKRNNSETVATFFLESMKII